MAAQWADSHKLSTEPHLWGDPLEGPLCTPLQALMGKAPPEAPRSGPRFLPRHPDSPVSGSGLQRTDRGNKAAPFSGETETSPGNHWAPIQDCVQAGTRPRAQCPQPPAYKWGGDQSLGGRRTGSWSGTCSGSPGHSRQVLPACPLQTGACIPDQGRTASSPPLQQH